MLRFCQTLEVHTDFATLYLRGSILFADVDLVRAMCSRLPPTIRVLRLDATGLDVLDQAVRDGLNEFVADWRADRNGQVIIAGSRRDVQRGDAVPRMSVDASPPTASALMATFL